MRPRKWVIGGVILLGILSLFLLWQEGTRAGEQSYQSLYSSLGVQRITPPIKAEDFTLKSLEGSLVSLKDLEGKVVFLNFRASWRGPDQWEMSAMQKLWDRFEEDRFVILAVDIQEGKAKVKSFIKEKGYTFPVLLDSGREVARIYEIKATPITFLIDPVGKIVGKTLGARDWASQSAFDLIERLLPKRKTDQQKDNPASPIPRPFCCQ